MAEQLTTKFLTDGCKLAPGEHDSGRRSDNLVEIVILYIHVVDRVMFMMFGPNLRGEVVDRLVGESVTQLIERYVAPTNVDTFGRTFFATGNQRALEYAECSDLVPGDGEAETVFMRATKILTREGDPASAGQWLCTVLPDLMLDPIMKILKADDID